MTVLENDQPASEPGSRAFPRGGARLLSPLRYPGAKRRLAGYVQEALKLNGLRPALFVEPFAGGASVALHVLAADCADRVLISDSDPLVASFWQVLFGEPDWLVQQVLEVEVTIEAWKRFKRGTPTTDKERAIACLFLNRTSFSGVIAKSGGPIGGMDQRSQYKIDCRFPRERLAKRIRQAAAYRDRVDVQTLPWHVVTQRHGRNPQAFFYLDPPFFTKADRLYDHFFANGDHQNLRDALADMSAKWLLSYDPSPRIAELYGSQEVLLRNLESLHSAARPGGFRRANEVILTNLGKLPEETRLWRSSLEWTQSKKR